MQRSIENILAEIDEVSMAKTASAAPNDDMAKLAEKLAQAADALDNGTSMMSTYAGTLSGPDGNVARPSAEQRVIDKIAESAALAQSMRLIGMVDQAILFSKTAAARGHDGVEAFKFFYQQQMKELGA